MPSRASKADQEVPHASSMCAVGRASGVITSARGSSHVFDRHKLHKCFSTPTQAPPLRWASRWWLPAVQPLSASQPVKQLESGHTHQHSPPTGAAPGRGNCSIAHGSLQRRLSEPQGALGQFCHAPTGSGGGRPLRGPNPGCGSGRQQPGAQPRGRPCRGPSRGPRRGRRRNSPRARPR